MRGEIRHDDLTRSTPRNATELHLVHLAIRYQIERKPTIT